MRNCLSCMFGSKSCHIRVAIDTAAEITLFRSTFSSARADTTFDEWTYARVFIHIHFLERFLTMRFGETLSLSRVDTVISRSGSPHDASHLPSILCFINFYHLTFITFIYNMINKMYFMLQCHCVD